MTATLTAPAPMPILVNCQEIDRIIAHVIAQCWTDADFKQKLLENPKAVIEQQFNIQFPPKVEVRVELYSHRWRLEPSPEMSGAVFTVPLPHRPDGYADEEIEQFASDPIAHNACLSSLC